MKHPTVTKLTLKQAQKVLARADAAQHETVRITSRGSLGRKVYALSAGIETRRWHARRSAALVVEAMQKLGVQSLDRVTVRSHELDDNGWSTVYLNGDEVVLVVHSQVDRHALGEARERELRWALQARKGGV